MKIFRALQSAILAGLLLSINPVIAAENKPEISIDGLQLVRESGFSLVYVLPGIDFNQYNRILLDDAYIAFRKDWQKEQNESGENNTSANDMAKIKIELGRLFRDTFSTTLEDSDYILTTEFAGDVLQIKPAIINLDIMAPATGSDSQSISYSASAGEMTLYLELYDSVSGDIIARVVDRRKDYQAGLIDWQNRINNRAAASRILQLWANTLRTSLDEARSVRQPLQ